MCVTHHYIREEEKYFRGTSWENQSKEHKQWILCYSQHKSKPVTLQHPEKIFFIEPSQ